MTLMIVLLWYSDGVVLYSRIFAIYRIETKEEKKGKEGI